MQILPLLLCLHSILYYRKSVARKFKLKDIVRKMILVSNSVKLYVYELFKCSFY